jgi:hypothetical protein
MSIRGQLVEAIAARKTVRLTYRGAAVRVGHPHVLYRGPAGKLLLDMYQVGGYSSSGDLPEWRMFELAGIDQIEVLPERFEPAPDYNPHNRARFQHIIASVEETS